MRYIFYCLNCDFVGSEEENKPIPHCPDCHVPLYKTKILRDDWRKMYEREKDALKSQWKNAKQSFQEMNNSENILITTGFSFEGYRIRQYKGIVSGEVVLGTGFMSEVSAQVNDLFGTSSRTFSEKLTKAKESALEQMSMKVANLGANAIIGVDFDILTFSNNMIGVSANGTAVCLDKI